MNYNLRIGEKTIPVEIDDRGEGQLKISIDQTDYDVTAIPVSDHQFHLDVNGKRYNVFLTRENDHPGTKIVSVNGTSFRIEDADSLDQRSKTHRSADKLPTEITPPMPAVVVRLLVDEGHMIKKGDGVVVVSAMKMETTLTAPFSGSVTRINVAEGDKVSPGQILVEVEKSEVSS